MFHYWCKFSECSLNVDVCISVSCENRVAWLRQMRFGNKTTNLMTKLVTEIGVSLAEARKAGSQCLLFIENNSSNTKCAWIWQYFSELLLYKLKQKFFWHECIHFKLELFKTVNKKDYWRFTLYIKIKLLKT